MIFGGSVRQGGKSWWEQQEALDWALARGHRVAVVRRSGTLVYRRHGHLTSITPIRDEPLDLWQDECATYCRYQIDEDNDNDPPPLAA